MIPMAPAAAAAFLHDLRDDDGDAVAEFSDAHTARTQERGTPIPVDAYGLEPDTLAATNELTPEQRVDVAVMTLGQRRALVRQALASDAFEQDPALQMPADKRARAERWLWSVSRAVCTDPDQVDEGVP
jgi:hypothetical protein